MYKPKSPRTTRLGTTEMALDDFSTDESEDEQQEEQNQETELEKKARLSKGAQNLLTERAVKSDTAEYDSGTITVEVDELALWFAVICLDVPEAETPELKRSKDER